MRECLQMLRERTPCDLVTLHVKSDNLAALAFYQKCAASAAVRPASTPRPPLPLSAPSPSRCVCRYGFDIDPNGFCKDHYLIDGVMYHAFRLTYAMPQPASAYLGFLPRSLCAVI